MKSVITTTAVLLLIGVAATSHFAGRHINVAETAAASEDTLPVVSIPSMPSQFDEVGPEFKLVLLALLPHGFETDEMQLEAGEYRFIIGNRTGVKEVNIRITREGTQQLAAATVGGRARDWKQRLNLTPGNYLISADENRNWTCRIVVRP
jgi:hypothetical protein